MKRLVPALGVAAAALLTLPWTAASFSAPAGGVLAAQETHLVVIGGAGGDPEYRALFHELSLQLIDAVQAAGLPSSNITYLSERPDRDERIQGESRKEDIEATFTRLAGQVDGDDQVFVLLIGHGSARGDDARFNIPGPDLTAAEFGGLLDKLGAGQIVFVNTASASAGFLPELSGAGRIVITATRSGSERNLTRFPRFFVEAYATEGSDTDKNGRVSVSEAFEYARIEVARSYERDNQIATEHPQLDDDGDGEGSGELTADVSDGRVARAAYLTPVTATATQTVDDPELQGLLNQRADLERRVQELRDLRDAMDPDEYERQLEDLLVELALVNRQIREKGGGP